MANLSITHNHNIIALFATHSSSLFKSIAYINSLLPYDDQKTSKSLECTLYRCRKDWKKHCEENNLDPTNRSKCNKFFANYESSSYNKKRNRGRKTKYHHFISDYPELKTQYEDLIQDLITKKQPEGRIILELKKFFKANKVSDCAKYLPSSPKTIYNWAKADLIPQRITNESKRRYGRSKAYDKTKKPGSFRTIEQRSIDFPNFDNETGHFELDIVIGAARATSRLSLMERQSRWHLYTPLDSLKPRYVANEVITSYG
ncbi:hypothetical protein [Psittacicella hinzii]|uniref:Uncharacterized protein n=1 Tax=Psittacicella hinzii TaxID=2028575 RepID=A0A3A1YIA8_9GAMM|nr:hypothetical protein [Psittacicella hinzii]RIY37892.1 hypothetical protein CKF58_04510 [Psittacicella hinzii]